MKQYGGSSGEPKEPKAAMLGRRMEARALAHMCNQQVAACWHTWVQSTEEVARLRRHLRQGVRMLVHRFKDDDRAITLFPCLIIAESWAAAVASIKGPPRRR